jgi:hypothetical protein
VSGPSRIEWWTDRLDGSFNARIRISEADLQAMSPERREWVRAELEDLRVMVVQAGAEPIDSTAREIVNPAELPERSS